MLIEQPWARVNSPVNIPDTDLRERVTSLELEEFARLIQSNLVPRDSIPNGRRQWAKLWELIDRDPDLADRTFDILEEFLDASETAAADAALSDQQRQRAAKFARFCNDAWKRLENVPGRDEPLGWAGRSATAFNRPARRVIQRLVDAISEHRDGTLRDGPGSEADERLWSVLQRVGLDPARFHGEA